VKKIEDFIKISKNKIIVNVLTLPIFSVNKGQIIFEIKFPIDALLASTPSLKVSQLILNPETKEKSFPVVNLYSIFSFGDLFLFSRQTCANSQGLV
jgi:hypothetical protein